MRYVLGMLVLGVQPLLLAQQLVIKEHTVQLQNAAGQTVLRYRYEAVPFKPYVDLLTTPSGINVLLDAPPDHLHHHGMMFAVKLNGVNFWEEQEAPGVQSQSMLTQPFQGVRQDVLVSGFSQELFWQKDNTGCDVLANETRSLQLIQGSDLGATVVTWRTHLKKPECRDAVELSGAHYHGLGMRFPATTEGKVIPAWTEPGEPVRGTELLHRGPWCAYQALFDGKPVTVAMFASGSNKQKTTWFTMTEPFAYLSATLEPHRKPFPLSDLDLLYAVALWDGHVDKETIHNMADQWWSLFTGGTEGAD